MGTKALLQKDALQRQDALPQQDALLRLDALLRQGTPQGECFVQSPKRLRKTVSSECLATPHFQKLKVHKWKDSRKPGFFQRLKVRVHRWKVPLPKVHPRLSLKVGFRPEILLWKVPRFSQEVSLRPELFFLKVHRLHPKSHL